MAYKKEKGKSPTEMGKTPTYMKSGFKMKSGSPFQRNFGIGASPVKNYSVEKGSHDHPHGDEKSPMEMASPMKRYNNMKSYSKPGDAVQFGDGIKMHKPNHGDFSQMSPSWAGDEEAMKELSRKRSRVNELGELPSMTDEQNEEYQSLKAEVLEMDRQYDESQKGLPMQSPVKHSGRAYAAGVEKELGKKPSYDYAKAHDKAYGKGHTTHEEQNPKKGEETKKA